MPPPRLINPTLPAGEMPDFLTEYLRGLERDYVELVVQDLRWRLRMATARLIVGAMEQEEHDKLIEDLTAKIRAVRDLPDGD